MVEAFLLRGRQNARSRRTLCMLTGLSDRKVRHEIEKLREQGVLVCVLEGGFGYYISEETSDLLSQYKQDMARIKAISKRTKHFRRILKERGVEV